MSIWREFATQEESVSKGENAKCCQFRDLQTVVVLLRVCISLTNLVSFLKLRHVQPDETLVAQRKQKGTHLLVLMTGSCRIPDP